MIKKIKKIFSFDKKSVSYKKPILKIVVYIVLIFLMIYREHFIHIENKTINTIIIIICVLIGMICIFGTEIAICELLQVYENRNEKKNILDVITATQKGRYYNIEKIIFMAENNDIIEFQAFIKNKIVKLGASADNRIDSYKFFDKLYYIDDISFESIKEFKTELLKLATGNQILIIKIDDIDVDKE